MKIKIAAMLIRLRDLVMCFRLHFTQGEWWRLRVRGVTQRRSNSKVRRTYLDRSRYTNEYTESLHSSTTWVRRNAARHSTALDNHMQLHIPSFSTCLQYHEHSLHNFWKQPQQPDFHFKLSGFLAAIKLTDKSGYPDNGYPDMQTLVKSRNRANNVN